LNKPVSDVSGLPQVLRQRALRLRHRHSGTGTQAAQQLRLFMLVWDKRRGAHPPTMVVRVTLAQLLWGWVLPLYPQELAGMLQCR
jgi:hypothetical protein